jgi:hypothetical protein
MYEGFSACACTFPCHKTHYDTRLSFGTLAIHAKTLPHAAAMQESFMKATDIFQKRDPVAYAENTQRLTGLASEILHAKTALQAMRGALGEFAAQAGDIQSIMHDKITFHQQWGLQKILQLANDKFLRGWSQFDEETLKHTTTYFDTFIHFIAEQLETYTSGHVDKLFHIRCKLDRIDLKQYISFVADAAMAIEVIHDSLYFGIPMANMSLSPLSYFDDAYLTDVFVQDILQYGEQNTLYNTFHSALVNFTSTLYSIQQDLQLLCNSCNVTNVTFLYEPNCNNTDLNTTLTATHLEQLRHSAIGLIRAKYTYYHEAVTRGTKNAEHRAQTFEAMRTKWMEAYNAYAITLGNMYESIEVILWIVRRAFDGLYGELVRYVEHEGVSLVGLCRDITSLRLKHDITTIQKQHSLLKATVLELGAQWQSFQAESAAILQHMANETLLHEFYALLASSIQASKQTMGDDSATFCLVLLDMLEDSSRFDLQSCDEILGNISAIQDVFGMPLNASSPNLDMSFSVEATLAHVDDLMTGNISMLFRELERNTEHCERYIASLEINDDFVRYV